MRLLDTKTRYFDQDTFQIPQLQNTWGCMVDLLDTALVYGSVTQNVLGITSKVDPDYPELYWKINIKVNLNHGFKPHTSVVQIVNSSIEAYNGVFRVQTVFSDSVEVCILKTEFPDKPENLIFVDGVLINIPGLGYEKVLEGPQKAVYKVTTAEDRVCFLRVDNSCPEGHNKAHAKFSRVSMFTDIEAIDDYYQKPSREKAPTYAEDYNRAEDYIYDIWLNTRFAYDDYVNINSTAALPVYEFCVVGDSQTFYLYINALTQHPSDNGDCTYLFGKYNKTMFKEDPAPFLLRTSERQNYTSNYFQQIADRDNFIGNRTKGKHLFSNVMADTFQSGVSGRWSQWYADSFISGQSTGVNYKYYRNEMTINLLPMMVLTHRAEATVVEGILRGTYFIMTNLMDSSKTTPNNMEIISQEHEHYLKIPAREDAWDYACYAVTLRDWE